MDPSRDHRALEKRRLQASALFARGLAPADVARRIGVRRQSAHAWFKIWQTHGSAGLLSRGPAGRKPRLTPPQLKSALAALAGDAGGDRTGAESRTLSAIAARIEAVTGTRFHPGHVWRLLRSSGIEVPGLTRRPRPRQSESQRIHKTSRLDTTPGPSPTSTK